uniref:Uncharacterized protein n=1 Tax=viral metagenome TaxID=1070528 RepID=A0A6C0AEC4_9ZZZZ
MVRSFIENPILIEENNQVQTNNFKINFSKECICISFLIIVVFFITPAIFISLGKLLYDIKTMNVVSYTVTNETCTTITSNVSTFNCYSSNLIYLKDNYSCYYPYEKDNYNYKSTIDNAKKKISSKKKFIINKGKKCKEEPLFIKNLLITGVIFLSTSTTMAFVMIFFKPEY